MDADAGVVGDLRRLVVDGDDADVDGGRHARLGLGARHQREAVARRVAPVVHVLKQWREGKAIYV